MVVRDSTMAGYLWNSVGEKSRMMFQMRDRAGPNKIAEAATVLAILYIEWCGKIASRRRRSMVKEIRRACEEKPVALQMCRRPWANSMARQRSARFPACTRAIGVRAPRDRTARGATQEVLRLRGWPRSESRREPVASPGRE